MKTAFFICFLELILSLKSNVYDCRADGPPVIDVYEDDAVGDSTDDLVAAIGNSKDRIKRTAVNRRMAQKLMDFRIMKLGGLQGAIFRAMHGSRNKQSKEWQVEEDSSFKVWAPEAAANGIRVGAYWSYRRGVPVKEQVKEFLAAIRRTCRTRRRYVAPGEASLPLLGLKILLVVDSASFDRSPLEPDVAVLRRSLEALRELHSQTGVWPGFYPEMGDPKEGGVSEIFEAASKDLTPDEVADYRQCWLWISSYSTSPDHFAMRAFTQIWATWTLWQYCPSETWQRKERGGWNPVTTSREQYAGGLASLTFAEYPRGIMGAAIPLDCNGVNSAVGSVEDLWTNHGWVAIP